MQEFEQRFSPEGQPKWRSRLTDTDKKILYYSQVDQSTGIKTEWVRYIDQGTQIRMDKFPNNGSEREIEVLFGGRLGKFMANFDIAPKLRYRVSSEPGETRKTIHLDEYKTRKDATLGFSCILPGDKEDEKTVFNAYFDENGSLADMNVHSTLRADESIPSSGRRLGKVLGIDFGFESVSLNFKLDQDILDRINYTVKPAGGGRDELFDSGQFAMGQEFVYGSNYYKLGRVADSQNLSVDINRLVRQDSTALIPEFKKEGFNITFPRNINLPEIYQAVSTPHIIGWERALDLTPAYCSFHIVD